MRFYRLTDDVYHPNRWYIGDVLFSDNWDLKHSVDNNKSYEFVVHQSGSEMDFTCSSAFGVCVVSQEFKDSIEGTPGIEFAKANISEGASNTDYYLMAVSNEVTCIDESQSEFDKFEMNDSIRPDLAGDYSGFFKMVVNPELCAEHEIFRIKGFSCAIIVSRKIKDKIESANLTGCKFESV